MHKITREEFQLTKDVIKTRIKEGAVFIHPTDTIYGIGCNALDNEAVKKIRAIKQRYQMPFSVIAPSKKWIEENCVIGENAKEWIKKLPGPYTLILKLKNRKAVAESTTAGLDTLGVRIPDHWFARAVSEFGFPVVTTSANVTGKNFMTSVDDIDPKIRRGLDFIVYEGPKKGTPSNIIDLAKGEIEIKER